MSHVLLDTASPDKWRLRVKSAMTVFLVDTKFAMTVFEYKVSCRA